MAQDKPTDDLLRMLLERCGHQIEWHEKLKILVLLRQSKGWRLPPQIKFVMQCLRQRIHDVQDLKGKITALLQLGPGS
eukprot:7224169-Prorocentrum_lima.AAC.1